MTNFHPLSDGERELVFRAAEVFQKDVTIPCTGCRYCMECPQGVDIPPVFAAYNDYAVDKDLHMFRRHYEQLGGKQADRCIKCGQCAPIVHKASRSQNVLWTMGIALAKGILKTLGIAWKAPTQPAQSATSYGVWVAPITKKEDAQKHQKEIWDKLGLWGVVKSADQVK